MIERRLINTVTNINWEKWEAGMHATLVFVHENIYQNPNGRVLLIRKKRGLGAGNINGPGGKIDAGESAEQAAIREVEEELLITPLNLQKRGELRFQFTDGLSILCHVFFSSNFKGEAQETDEAIPHWFRIKEIPYEEMWADDAIWLPPLLLDEKLAFHGWFIFDDKKMLSQKISWHNFVNKNDTEKFYKNCASDNGASLIAKLIAKT